MLEIAVIAVLGLLVFGPEKLPKAIQALVAGIRSLRGMATEATSSLQDAAGIDSEDAKKTMSDLAELHPKRWASGFLNDDVGPAPGADSTTGPTSKPSRSSQISSVQKNAPNPSDVGLDPDLP